VAQLPSISSQAGADVVKTITNIKNIDHNSKRNRHVNSWQKSRMRGLQNPTLPLALLVSNTDSPLCARFEQIESDSPYNIWVRVKPWSFRSDKELTPPEMSVCCLFTVEICS